ncbi:MAG: YhaI family protein [Candidatus Bathyarchaeota archaeon]|nr:YhaI family protein [Candidatus Bathyarchaeota archaeon]
MAVYTVEDRLKKLEGKIAMLVSVTDYEKYPFICACLDADLDLAQVDKILALISEAENLNNTPNEMSYHQFEEELITIVPSKRNDSHFVKSIVKALNKEHKFLICAKKFRDQGIEI